MDFKRDAKGQVMDKPIFREKFKKSFGEPDERLEIDAALLQKYQDILPDEMLLYWKTYGLTSFHQGLFWFTNPDAYEEIVRSYLAETKLSNVTHLYVVARSAFGKLYVWEKGKGDICWIKLLDNSISLNAVKDRQTLSAEEEEYEMNRFIGTSRPKNLDREDSSGKPLFERALKKFGRVEAHEMYGYKLNPALGGKESIRNLEKVDLFIYADIQIGIEKPWLSVIDTENKTYSY